MSVPSSLSFQTFETPTHIHFTRAHSFPWGSRLSSLHRGDLKRDQLLLAGTGGEKINVMRSIHSLGAIMTRMALGGNQDPWGLSQQPEGSPKQETEIDHVVMETKLKIIEILEFIMNVRLDYRISSLLTIFKRDFDESNAGLAEMNGENGIAILILSASMLFIVAFTSSGNCNWVLVK